MISPWTARPFSVQPQAWNRFQSGGDRDWVAFDAKKGDVIWIEVLSHCIGRDTDPYLVVQKVTKTGEGKETVQELKAVDEAPRPKSNQIPTFDLSRKDPSFQLAADADATYRVMVRDLYNSSRGLMRVPSTNATAVSLGKSPTSRCTIVVLPDATGPCTRPTPL